MAQAANTPFDVPPRLQAYMELHATSGRLKSPDITQPLADLGRQRAQLLKAATSEPLVQAFRQFEAVRRELALAKRAEAWAQINRAEPERIQELKRSFENVYPRVMDMVMLREAIRQSDAKFLSAAEELSASALAVIAAATPRLEIAERQAAQELKIAQRPVQQEFMQAQRTVKLAKHSADETIPAAIEESERATQADIERLQQEAFDSVRRAQQEAAVLLQRAEAEAANIRDRADAATARTFKPALAAAQLATAKLDEAKEAVAVSMTHLATVTQDVSAPRPRIVPFALPGQLDLT
jgi:hypothetical protein